MTQYQCPDCDYIYEEGVIVFPNPTKDNIQLFSPHLNKPNTTIQIFDSIGRLVIQKDNCCEDKEGLTKWEVLHAEANAILKVASSTQSAKGSTLYITLSPCTQCSKLIHQAGIKRVVYAKNYRDSSGIDFLEKAGVELKYLPYE